MASALGIGVTLIVATIWALASVVYKSALGSAGTEIRDPLTTMGVRSAIIVGFFAFIIAIFGDFGSILALPSDQALPYWLLGIANGALTLVGDICYFNALRFIDSSRVYPLINIQILFTYPLAYVFFGENIPPWLWVAGISMITGVVLISKKDLKDRGMEKRDAVDQHKTHLWGIVLGLWAGLLFALQYLALQGQNRIYNSVIESNFTRLASYAVMIWAFLLITRKHLPRWSTPSDREQTIAYIKMGLIGCASMGIADSIYQIGVMENGSALSITLVSTSPLFNQFFARGILKEKFRRYFLLGVFCIVLGMICAVL
ncbi:MAG: hypothetical protein RBG13Loki_2150 [Promethearchaeota archaeon CR_4]|nr:MAG: hypothetical protein RBG13Loki_2150 [Candidatus Lokiarchaeota archaeon CR_4]